MEEGPNDDVTVVQEKFRFVAGPGEMFVGETLTNLVELPVSRCQTSSQSADQTLQLSVWSSYVLLLRTSRQGPCAAGARDNSRRPTARPGAWKRREGFSLGIPCRVSATCCQLHGSSICRRGSPRDRPGNGGCLATRPPPLSAVWLSSRGIRSTSYEVWGTGYRRAA